MKLITKINAGLVLVLVLVPVLALALWSGVSSLRARLYAADYAEVQLHGALELSAATDAWLRALERGDSEAEPMARIITALDHLDASARRERRVESALEERDGEAEEKKILRENVMELERLHAFGAPSTAIAAVESRLIRLSSDVVAGELREANEADAKPYESLARTAWWVLGSTLFAAFAVTATAVTVARQVRRGIAGLEAGTRGIAEDGIPSPIDVVGNDEFADVMRRFNEMVVRLRDTQKRVHETEVEARRLSRAAGMAEVAAGVLHNLGNCLTSVTTSADVLSTLARSPQLDRVRELAVFLAPHENDLAAFLRDDPRGKNVLPFVRRLGDELVAVRERLQDECEVNQRKLEHALVIIHAQQEAARPSSALLEELSTRDLVEFAATVALGSSRDRLTLDWDAVPSLIGMGDRHRILQILINLLSNAEHAVLDNPRPAPRIVLRAERRAGDRVAIIVTDNGNGLREGDRDRIFQFGYTTKAKGNGFGLHASANAAAEMGGRLTCESAGPDRGATFELELPWPIPCKAERLRRPSREDAESRVA